MAASTHYQPADINDHTQQDDGCHLECQPPSQRGIGRSLPPELGRHITAFLSPRDVYRLRYVNKTWNAAGEYILAHPHGTLGLPVPNKWSAYNARLLPTRPRDVASVPASQLDNLRMHGRKTKVLDVHPHTDCARLSLPNVDVLRVFAMGSKLAVACGPKCPAMATPRVLVVYASTTAVGLLPSLLPKTLLQGVGELVLVLPSATASTKIPPSAFRGQRVTVVLAKHEGGFLRPVPALETLAVKYIAPLSTSMAIVGAHQALREAYEEEYPGKVEWLSPGEYFASERLEGVFTAAETAAMGDSVCTGTAVDGDALPFWPPCSCAALCGH